MYDLVYVPSAAEQLDLPTTVRWWGEKSWTKLSTRTRRGSTCTRSGEGILRCGYQQQRRCLGHEDGLWFVLTTIRLEGPGIVATF